MAIDEYAQVAAQADRAHADLENLEETSAAASWSEVAGQLAVPVDHEPDRARRYVGSAERVVARGALNAKVVRVRRLEPEVGHGSKILRSWLVYFRAGPGVAAASSCACVVLR